MDVSPGERRLAAPGGPARGPAPRTGGGARWGPWPVSRNTVLQRGTHEAPTWSLRDGAVHGQAALHPLPASGTFQPRQTRGCHRTWVPSRGGEATGDPGRRFGIRGGERGLVRVALLLTKTKVVIFCRVSPRRVTAQVQRTPGRWRVRHPAPPPGRQRPSSSVPAGLLPLRAVLRPAPPPDTGDLPSSSPSAAGQA